MKILLIETATAVCSVALCSEDHLLDVQEIEQPNVHASQLTVLINNLMERQHLCMEDLNAVAVSKGPGSYTGLRIGVSVAKGICYALDIPLIAIDTLEAMAKAFIGMYADKVDSSTLYWPMIDARRMEVYTAAYNKYQQVVFPTAAKILDANSFLSLRPYPIYLFGSGADKFKELYAGDTQVQVVTNFRNSAKFMKDISLTSYQAKAFEDVAYFEPYYLKDFIPTTPKK